MPTIEAIASDADGTLVDTVALIRHGQHQTAVEFLKQRGVPDNDLPGYEEYEMLLNRVVGGSARQTLERTVKILFEDKAHHLEGIDYDELNRMLDPIQDRLAPEYVRAFPGLADTLSQIGSMGIKLAIFTSGTPHHVVRNFGLALANELGDYASLYQDKSINDAAKLDKFVQRLIDTFHLPMLAVVTCDDVGERTKPDPLSINIALQRLNVRPENMLVLGDHGYDMQAAINAGIDVRIGVSHGFDDEAALIQAGATDVIKSLDELLPLLS